MLLISWFFLKFQGLEVLFKAVLRYESNALPVFYLELDPASIAISFSNIGKISYVLFNFLINFWITWAEFKPFIFCKALIVNNLNFNCIFIIFFMGNIAKICSVLIEQRASFKIAQRETLMSSKISGPLNILLELHYIGFLKAWSKL